MVDGASPIMPSDRQTQISEIRALVAAQCRLNEAGASIIEKSELQLRKWRMIHKHLHAHPFPTKARAKRSEQWRDAVQCIRGLDDMDVLDWVLLQADVAGNIERGIREMRPRKNGPCHALLLEYVRDRKRKALAVYKWSLAADEANTATKDTLTTAILKRHSTKGTGGTENL